ncbi:Saccharopine dehydrogenase [Syncephalis plumigaleata]|nr:Saccharopine dehydrogenase [Syncephalis plumigaleata]
MSAEKKVLLLGSGFVARPCLAYILRRPENRVTVACRRLEVAAELASQFERATPLSLDVTNEEALDAAVAEHDLVISLIPYTQHARVIKSAIKSKKNVVTTSYVSEAMMALDEEAKAAGITVMNEIGLDPGIDHLYAVKTIEEVHAQGGKILSFLSYCGGLPAPEASNNPLGYKFSWSSRGVLLALRNTARYYEDGKIVEYSGTDLMSSAKPIYIYPAFAFVGYPNRDSAQTILRGTLRYQGFPKFVKALVDIGFLDDTPKDYLATDASDITWVSSPTLRQVITEKINESPAEVDRILDGMKWLGLFSDTKVHRRGNNLDTLCATLEEKMMYEEGERDMVMLQHRFGIELADGTKQTRTSTLLAYGEPNGDTSMATTLLILDELLEKEGIGMVEAIL